MTTDVSQHDPSAGSGTPDEAPLTPRLTLGLLFIILLGELSAVGYILVATVLPNISSHFQVTTQLSWTFTVLSIASGVLVGVTGKLADLRGKRLILAGLISIATVGCVLSAVATTYGVFLAGRALQGCLYLVPAMGFSLIRDVFPKKYVALGASMAFTGAGVVFVFGPFLAGWLASSFGVLSIFWFCALFQVVCLSGVLLTVPESPVRVPGRLDWVGAALLGLGSVAVLYAIGQGPAWGWFSLEFVGLLGIGVACFAAWLAWDSRFSDPLISMELLGSRRFRSTLLLTFLGFAAIGPVGTLFPMLLQTPDNGTYGFGLDAYGVARYSIALGILTMAGGVLVGLGARRWGIRGPLMVGIILLAGSALAFATVPTNSVLMITLMGLYGLGNGLTSASIPNLMMQSVPPGAQGISAATQVVASNLGQAVATQLAFALLGAHLVASTGAYSHSGFAIAFAVAAVAGALAMVAALLMPHGRRRDVLDAQVGSEQVS